MHPSVYAVELGSQICPVGYPCSPMSAYVVKVLYILFLDVPNIAQHPLDLKENEDTMRSTGKNITGNESELIYHTINRLHHHNKLKGIPNPDRAWEYLGG